MKVDFRKIVFKTVEGLVRNVEAPYKMVADLLYNFTTSVEMARLAMDIDKYGEIEVDEKELEQMKAVIKESPTIFAWVKLGIIQFLEIESKRFKRNIK